MKTIKLFKKCSTTSMKHKEPTIVVTSTNAKGFCGILDNLSINTDDQKKLKNAS